MKGLGSLIKMHLNVNFGISAMKYKYFKQKKEVWQPLVFIIAIFFLLPIYIRFINLLGGMFSILKSINQEGVLLLMGILGSQLILFIFGISHVFSKFYYADDIQILIPLPVKPSTILTARFITVMINEYLTILPIILPVLIVYGIQSGLGVLYWIYCILIIFAIPVIPLALSTIVTMIFMRYTNIKGKRDLIRVIGGVLMVVIILGIQVISQRSLNTLPPGGEVEYISNLVSQKNVLINQMGASFPPSIWASNALINFNNSSGIFSLLVFVSASLLIFAPMIYLSEKVFYKGLIGGREVSSKKKSLNDKQFNKKIGKGKHPIVAVLEKDIKILIRTPIFLMNTIGSVIIIPIAFAIPFISTNNQLLNTITEFYINGNTVVFNLILVGCILFIATSNGVGATTFSREGRQFWILRVVPLKVEYQLIGKILSAILAQVLALIIILGGASFILPLKLSTIIVVTTIGILGSIPIIVISMLIDISRPVLDWDNPQKAVKQNMNVLFSMLAGMAYIAGYAILCYNASKIGLNPIITYSLIGLIFTIVSVLLYKALNKFTRKRLKDIV